MNSIHSMNREPKTKGKNVVYAFEHKPVPIKKSGSSDDQSLTEREVQILKRLDQKLDGTLFKVGTEEVCFLNWVGVIGLGNRAIEILPKIDYFRKQSEEDRNLVRDQLIYMLAATGEIPHHLVTKASLLSRRMPPLEVYIRLFVTEALRLLRRGLVHNYIKHEDEQTFLRGKLRITEQIRLTDRRIPRFAIRYQEHSPDNPLNRIIKDVARMLRDVTKNYKNQRQLLYIDAILEGVSYKKHTARDADNINLDRKTYGYEMLLALCRLFLQKRIPDFSAGETPVIPILFDMNKLFERFIGQMLRRMVLRGELPSFREVQLGKGGRYLLQRANNKGREDILKLKPDIQLIETSNKALPSRNDRLSIIDTKWKPLDSQKKLHGITVDDLYQMFAYTIKYQPRRTILLYPKTINLKNGDGPLETFFVEENSPSEGKIEAWTVDLADTNKNTFYDSIKGQLKKIVEWTVAKNGK